MVSLSQCDLHLSFISPSPCRGFALPFCAHRHTRARTHRRDAFHFLSLHMLASLGSESLYGPRISPAAQTLGPEAPSGSPFRTGGGILGTSLWLGLGLVETLDTVTEMRVLR